MSDRPQTLPLQVLTAIAAAGFIGLTDTEISQTVGRARPVVAATRMTLANQGYVKHSGHFHGTKTELQHIWVATAAGLAHAKPVAAHR